MLCLIWKSSIAMLHYQASLSVRCLTFQKSNKGLSDCLQNWTLISVTDTEIWFRSLVWCLLQRGCIIACLQIRLLCCASYCRQRADRLSRHKEITHGPAITCTIHSISAQNSQAVIKCTGVLEKQKSHCLIYILCRSP